MIISKNIKDLQRYLFCFTGFLLLYLFSTSINIEYFSLLGFLIFSVILFFSFLIFFIRRNIKYSQVSHEKIYHSLRS